MSYTKSDFVEIGNNGKLLYEFLENLPKIDNTELEKRSKLDYSLIKSKESGRDNLNLLTTLIDLTTLEGSDTTQKIEKLINKATLPELRNNLPEVAAICIYGDLVGSAKSYLKSINNNTLKVAAVSTAFPSGRASINVKLLDTDEALQAGADEIDMVIDRGALLMGEYQKVYKEIKAIKELSGNRVVKVIIESGELGSYENIKKASYLAMIAGADFIKTSTGKIPVGATPSTVICMIDCINEFYKETGVKVGIKPSGQIKSYRDGLNYLNLVRESLGSEWLSPNLFRIGASSMLDDIIFQSRNL